MPSSCAAPSASLPLGTQEVTPLELATAYGTLAQQGMRAAAVSIVAVADEDGAVIRARWPRAVRALSAESAYLVTDLLRGVFERGTARSASALGFRQPAAGKTGTTDDTRDSWFVGFTPDLLALVWVGYDDNARTGLTGATGALPIWVDLMNRIGPEGHRRWPARPEGIGRRAICERSGQIARRGCPDVAMESFAYGTEPERCTMHDDERRWFRRWREKKPGRSV